MPKISQKQLEVDYEKDLTEISNVCFCALYKENIRSP